MQESRWYDDRVSNVLMQFQRSLKTNLTPLFIVNAYMLLTKNKIVQATTGISNKFDAEVKQIIMQYINAAAKEAEMRGLTNADLSSNRFSIAGYHLEMYCYCGDQIQKIYNRTTNTGIKNNEDNELIRLWKELAKKHV